MDGLEGLDQEVELPLQLRVDLRADFEAYLCIVLARNLVILNQTLHELFNARLVRRYLFA